MIELKNLQAYLRTLDQIPEALRSRAITAGMQAAAKVVNEQAKRNLWATKKGKSTTDYAYYSSLFRIENMKPKPGQLAGVKAGVQSPKHGYKLRFLEFGTAPRRYMITANLTQSPAWKWKKRGTYHATGRITATHFFYSAVDAKKLQAFSVIEGAIKKALAKYD